MNSRAFFAVVGILFMIIILVSVRKKKFFVKDSFYWFLLSVGILLLSIFPSIIRVVANVVEVEYAPSLLFFIAIIFILYIVFNLSQQVSLLREQNKDLAQRVAVLKKIINDIEKDKEKNNIIN
ncbi:DUF2304 domain-containing protein [Clostridium septicum]|uniref:DUF2304 domain-containing protein n=1 Tax=Clostridium septicum TaxID=1504 RepID=A0A9N7JM60_CLOSE|nr:DUF2304 domain-containing protein [Clostridium septicum]AYE34870.1 DUF2304 domain-containing protein [Clostridium septicum]MDU1314696.1 DUF2304 domain-containing protein [Clostridium septicum]QAS60265.1 DUF2304 domain-containing protein [Clostridium septicum]UEC20480.1 DUF2304 domain-containing protein [Clostridium septicum]USS01464.1 DUF2304 domain-containing protein [Clostridium septicum]